MESHARLRQIALLFLGSAVLLSSCAQRVVIKQQLGSIISKPMPIAKARDNWEKIEAGTATPEDIIEYNEAVSSALAQIAVKASISKNPQMLTIRTTEGPVPVKVNNPGHGDHAFSDFDLYLPATYTKIKKGLRERTVDIGLGTPLAARMAPDESDPFIAREGLWAPVTAILEFESPDEPHLHLYNSLDRTHLRLGNREVAIQSDYSTPLATALASRERQIIALPAMIHFEEFHKHLRLTRLSPFSPSKTPVVLVHGLKSSPSTWKNTINELLADPFVRENYEFWAYGYPTGAPVPYSSYHLRKDLQQMKAFRLARGASSDDTVLIGHSMGGLLSKNMTQRSDQQNWDRIFNKPLSELKITDSQRELLRGLVYFEPLDCVERVIFISTPHRGSDFAEKPIGKIGAGLIELPNQLVTLSANLLATSASALTPLGIKLTTDIPTSIDQLRSDSDLIKVLAEMQLNPNVRYHSIIGRENLRGDLESSSDGLVPYSSAHIEGAESELVVVSEHNAHQAPDAIAEIARILRLHLGR